MKAVFVCLVLALGVAGCGRESRVAPKQTPVTGDYWSLPNSAVVVKVDEYWLTKGENERRMDLQVALVKASRQRMDKRQESDYRSKLLRTSEFAYIQDVVLTRWGKANGVVLTDADWLEGRARFAKNLSRGIMSYDVLKSRIPDVDPEEIDAFVDRATYVGRCADKIAELNEKPLASDELAKRRRTFVEYNKRVAATNALVWAEASNLWKRVQADVAAFDREVEKYQENEAEHVFSDPDMGEVSLSFFEDDPVWKERLAKAKEGDVLPPRLGDNGVLMVKILQCIPISAQENGKEPRWRFAKMFWELAAEWEPQTDEELLADLKMFHRRDGRERGMKEVLSAAKISYPSGTNLLKRVRTNKRPLPKDDRIPVSVRRKLEQQD